MGWVQRGWNLCVREEYVYSRREGSYYSLSNKARSIGFVDWKDERKLRRKNSRRRSIRAIRHINRTTGREIERIQRRARWRLMYLVLEQESMSVKVTGVVMGYWFPPEVDRGYTKPAAPCRPIASHGAT